MWERRLERLPELMLVNGMRLRIADRPSARLAGLSSLREMPRRTGLLIPRCRSVHTFGVRFALDLIWLDEDGAIVDVTPSVAPRRLVSRAQAAAVVETRAGAGARMFAALAAAWPGAIPTRPRAARDAR